MNTKTLILAGFAVLSLGVGSAMAQDGSGGSYPDFQSTLTRAKTAVQAPAATSQVQSGSSDVERMQPGTATFIFNHNLSGASGVAG
jgi:hypothetical protein